MIPHVQDIDSWLHEMETSGNAKRKALESLVLHSARSIQLRRDTLFSIETSIIEEKEAIVSILKKQGESAGGTLWLEMPDLGKNVEYLQNLRFVQFSAQNHLF